MGKRDVIVRYVSRRRLADGGGGDRGGDRGPARRGHRRIAVLILMAVAWATFTPNARLFGRVSASGSTAEPMVRITFDDGPSPEWTPGVLDALRDAGARATFFALGRQVRAHPDIAQRIVAEGHELAGHGEDHSLLVFAGPRAIVRQFPEADSALAAAVDGKAQSCSVRPTVSETRSSRRSLASRATGWSDGTGAIFDTARPGVDAIVARCRTCCARAPSCSCTTATAPDRAATGRRPSRPCRTSSRRCGSAASRR